MQQTLAIALAAALLVLLGLVALTAHCVRVERLRACEDRCFVWRPGSVVGDPAEFCEVACRTSRRPERAFPRSGGLSR